MVMDHTKEEETTTAIEGEEDGPVFIHPNGSLTAEYIAVFAEKVVDRIDQLEAKIDLVLEIVGTQHGTVPAADDEGELIN
jgi:hypothetical protein